MRQLIPEKSQKKYEKQYKNFKKWQNENNINEVSETIMLAYFSDISKRVKHSSIWSYYSMLKSMLALKDNVDISKYSTLLTLIKTLTKDYKPKKSKALEPGAIIDFLKDAKPDMLLVKVVAIIGLFGACRVEELYKLRITDVEDRGAAMIVSVTDAKDKVDRSFCITDNECGVSFLEIIREYLRLRPKNLCHDKFFLTYRNESCINQPVGINALYKMPKIIADYLKLDNPEQYSGHCFRRSAQTMLVKYGTVLNTVKRGGGIRK